MPRPRDRAQVRRDPDLLTLMMGPTEAEGFTDEDLEVGWLHHRERAMDQLAPGTRPWGWWRFVACEEMPCPADPIGGDSRLLEAVRLAELAQLTAEELAALREEANEAKLRIDTNSERISGGWAKYGVSLDQQAVDLWEAVESTLGAQREEAG
jgi:hypothetical protein